MTITQQKHLHYHKQLMMKLKRKRANEMLLDAKVAIHQLKELGPDYEIWQNANISYKTLKQITKKLDLIG